MKKVYAILFILFVFVVYSFNNSSKIVIIDAGHGGNDNGATVENIYEKNITQSIAEKIKSLNTNDKIKIILTREGDTYPTLTDRINFINQKKPDLVISLHANYSPKNKDKNGAEIYTQNSEASKNLGKSLSTKFDDCIVKEMPLKILKDSQSNALLLEAGYLSNTDDRNYLTNTDGQKEIATKILEFLNEDL